jgi:hypothetical protein
MESETAPRSLASLAYPFLCLITRWKRAKNKNHWQHRSAAVQSRLTNITRTILQARAWWWEISPQPHSFAWPTYHHHQVCGFFVGVYSAETCTLIRSQWSFNNRERTGCVCPPFLKVSFKIWKQTKNSTNKWLEHAHRKSMNDFGCANPTPQTNKKVFPVPVGEIIH